MTTAEKRAARPPLESVRETPFSLCRAAEDGEPDDGLTLDGYGAVFGTRTIIDSWEGRFAEEFALGSMKRSFRETPPKVQFDHGRHPMIGSIPIAALRSISEEVDPQLAPKGGAHIVARIFDNWLMAPVRDAIAAGAVSGMSMRFGVVRESWTTYDGKPIRDEQVLMQLLREAIYDDVPDDQLPIRTVKEAKVPEMGPVVWPAYAETSVSVRSQVIDLGRLHEPEQRKLLATAVFLADAAEQDDDTQRDAGDEPAVEHQSKSVTDDAQRSTTAVGERPSKPLTANLLRLRQQRDTLINIKQKGTSR
jgi:phage head maturation protease